MTQEASEIVAHEKEYFYVSQPFPYELTGAPKILMEMCALIEMEYNTPFAFVGGFTRDYGKSAYNDIDVATNNPQVYRERLAQMGVLLVAEDGMDNPHDYFIDPYDLSENKIPVHFIYTESSFGFAPVSFDYGINEFALKSDGQLYAPTYAWREMKKQLLNLKPTANMTTNQLLRTFRLKAKTGFHFTEATIDAIQTFLKQQERLGSNRVLINIDKMIEDGVEQECFALMKAFNVPEIENHPDIHSFRKLHNDLILSGRAHIEGRRGY